MEPSDWSRLQTPVTVLRTLSPAPVINKVQIRFHQNLRTCGLHILHIVLLTKKGFYQGFVEVHEALQGPDLRRDKLMGVVEKGE